MAAECLTKQLVSARSNVQGSIRVSIPKARGSRLRLSQPKWGSGLSNGRYAQRSTVLKAVDLEEKTEAKTVEEGKLQLDAKITLVLYSCGG
jgi:hypothetical protein